MGRLHRALRRHLGGEGIVNWKGRGVVNLIDVGSAGDLPAPWHRAAPSIRNLLRFEPRGAGRSRPGVISVDCALWDAQEERDFFIYSGFGGTGSSLFEQNFEYVDGHFEDLRKKGPPSLTETWHERSRLVRVDRVRCRRLDDVLDELALPFPFHFLKVDAQGAEFRILRGAERFLGRDCLGLVLELFLIPLYKGIALLPSVADYLDGMGFDLALRNPPHGTFDSQQDCLFLRRGAQGEPYETIRRNYGL